MDSDGKVTRKWGCAGCRRAPRRRGQYSVNRHGSPGRPEKAGRRRGSLPRGNPGCNKGIPGRRKHRAGLRYGIRQLVRPPGRPGRRGEDPPGRHRQRRADPEKAPGHPGSKESPHPPEPPARHQRGTRYKARRRPGHSFYIDGLRIRNLMVARNVRNW